VEYSGEVLQSAQDILRTAKHMSGAEAALVPLLGVCRFETVAKTIIEGFCSDAEGHPRLHVRVKAFASHTGSGPVTGLAGLWNGNAGAFRLRSRRG